MGRRRRRWLRRTLAVVLVAGLAAGVVAVRDIGLSDIRAAVTRVIGDSAEERSLPPLPFAAAPVAVDTDGFLSWALLDRRTGDIVGSENLAATSTTASMVKPWLAADYLRRIAANGEQPSDARLADLTAMIRDSDNEAAERIYNLNGETDSIRRMIDLCELTESTATPGYWSTTRVSARDTVRLADCLADGRAAGPNWTEWLLEQMRGVRGDGDFGIRNALPAAEAARVAVKNGWLLRDDDGLWHVACLAVADDWAMAVLQRYPPKGEYSADFAHTRQVCQRVAEQLRTPAVA
jgi:Beta-lactamase enzyme family